MTKKRAPVKPGLGDIKPIAAQTPTGRASLVLEPVIEFSDALLATARKALADQRTSASDREWLENSIYLYLNAADGLRLDLASMKDLPKDMDKHLLRLVMATSALSKFGNEPASISQKIKREGIRAARETKITQDNIIFEKCRAFLRKRKHLTNSAAFAGSIKAQMDANVGAEVPVGTIRKRIAEVLAERLDGSH